MLTVSKCFSTLIASGNGKRCSELRSILSDVLSSTDENGISKTLIFKSKSSNFKHKASKISSEIASKIDHLYFDIDDYYFVNDLRKDE
jgi:hypothetical protein